LHDIQGYNPVHIRRYDEYFEAMNGRAQNYHFSEVHQGGLASPLLDLLNVRYIVVPSGASGGWDGAELLDIGAADREVFRNERVRVLENDDAFPRAWVVHKAQTVEPGAALALLADGAVDPARVALLEEAPPPLDRPPEGAVESVTMRDTDSPDRLRLDVHLGGAGLVVLSEVYDPNWRAYLDGERVPLLVADHILRAVPVPAGDHVVELRFEPWSLRAGLAVTAVTAIAILGVLLVSVRGPLRRLPSSPGRGQPIRQEAPLPNRSDAGWLESRHASGGLSVGGTDRLQSTSPANVTRCYEHR
jgi:hypothetical protein